MKTFNHITDVGRGRLFLKSNRLREQLFLTTTEDWVLKKDDGTEFLLPDSGSALEWALKNRLCSSRRAFLEHWVELIRIPYRGVIPEVRLIQNEPTDSSQDLATPFPSPTQRAQELIQHPMFNHCLVKHAHGEAMIKLTEEMRDLVVNIAAQIHETDYYVGAPVIFADGSLIQHVSDTPNIEQFAFNTGNAEYMIECFSVLQGADLPSDFKTRHGDESTWIRLANDGEIWSEGTLKKLASVAVAVCVYFQINDAYIYGFDEHPLALHALGPPDLYHW